MSAARVPRVHGGLLAGGLSRRMGRDKAGVVVDGSTGETLGERALAALRAVCDDVVVLGHGRGLSIDLPRVEDAFPEGGPVGGLLGLLAGGAADDGALFVITAVDMPGVEDADLRRLLGALAAAPDRHAAVLAHAVSGHREPLPLVVRGHARTLVAEACARGERRLGAVVDALSPVVVRATSAATHQNINTFDDLQGWAGGRRPG